MKFVLWGNGIKRLLWNEQEALWLFGLSVPRKPKLTRCFSGPNKSTVFHFETLRILSNDVSRMDEVNAYKSTIPVFLSIQLLNLFIKLQWFDVACDFHAAVFLEE